MKNFYPWSNSICIKENIFKVDCKTSNIFIPFFLFPWKTTGVQIGLNLYFQLLRWYFFVTIVDLQKKILKVNCGFLTIHISKNFISTGYLISHNFYNILTYEFEFNNIVVNKEYSHFSPRIGLWERHLFKCKRFDRILILQVLFSTAKELPPVVEY